MSARDPEGLVDRLTEAFFEALSEGALSTDEVRGRIQEIVQSAQGPDTSLIAHELRNPLAVIETSAFVLSERLSGDEGAMRHLSRIRVNVEAASALVAELLDPEAGSGGEVIDPVELLRQVVESLTLATKLRVRGDPSGPRVRGDPRRIKQVILNLLENARALDDSGEPIELEVRAREPWVEISVRDHGPGVDPSVLPKLFERGASRRPGGHGFGLYLSRQIAEGHHGRLSLESPEDGGARFILSLPIYHGA